MTKYHRGAGWITVFFKSDLTAVPQLNQSFVAHFLSQPAHAFQRLHCKPAICSSKCIRDIRHRPFVLLVMNDYSQPGAGKISVHANGVGAPSQEEVEKRARVVAMIYDRNPHEITDA